MTDITRRRAAALAAGSLAIPALVAPRAARSQALTRVTFQLNWTAGGPNAGFAAAVGEGYYRQAGLDVTIVQGNGSGNTAQLVANGRAQLAYADAVVIAQLIARGAPMRIVSTIYQSNPNQVSALTRSGIRAIRDLAGKRVAVPAGASQTPMLPLFLRANNLREQDMTLVNMPPPAMIPALMQGQVDAILGSMDSFQLQLEALGAETVNFRFAEHGVPTVSTSIFATNNFIRENPDVLRRFIAASLRGWSFALDQPERTIQHLKAVFPEVNERLATAELAAIGPLFCSGGARFIGRAEEAHWARTQELLSEVRLLPEGQDPTRYYTNEFLPPDAEMRACRA